MLYYCVGTLRGGRLHDLCYALLGLCGNGDSQDLR